jgi:hypothetical protein
MPRISHDGFSVPAGFQCGAGMIGSSASETTRSVAWSANCPRGVNRWTSASAYAYPASNAVWKNTRHVVQTAADPPNHGRICFAITGCSRNSRNALRKMVTA